MSKREAIAGVIRSAIDAAHSARPDDVPLIGVAGAQGSGKSFQCRAFAAAHPRIAHFSLDDVYRTKADRRRYAAAWHPLFITRGPPGTHDLDLAWDIVNALRDGEPVLLPRFDKAQDDRAPEQRWPPFAGPAEAILFDGWCLGALHVDGSSYEPPLNALEAEEDADGVWRRHIEGALATDYAGFFADFDAFIYLRAPSFEIVRRWRGEQEQEMLGRALTTEENAKLDRFVQHYERITRAMIEGRHSARWIVHLDEDRNVTRIEDRG